MSAIERLRGGRRPGARHHGRADARAVRGRAVQVGGHRRRGRPSRGDRPRRARRRRSDAPASSASAASARIGCRPEADEADGAAPDPVVVVELDADGGAGDREVAVAAGELLDGEAAPPAPDRERHADEELVGSDGRCSTGRRRSRAPRSCGGPRREATSMSASSASATAGYSAAGSAWAIDPPSVPRLRIWK